MKNEPNEAFKPYKIGEYVTYFDVKAMVTHIDNFTDWDAEIEKMDITYLDTNGVVHHDSLTPNKVKFLVSKRS